MGRVVASADARLFGVYLGRTMKAIRKAQRVKGHAVAEDIGLTPVAVSNWETGKTVPEIRHLFSFCDRLGVPIWRVLARAERAYRMHRTMERDRARHGESDDDAS